MQGNAIKIFHFILLFTASSLFSQQYTEGSPEWLLDMFFNSNSFAEKSDYYTGEMINDAGQPTIGEELQDSDAQILFYKINDADNEQTFAIELELDDRVIDFYCYLKYENGIWKMEAVRRFLLPGFIYSVRDSIANISTPSSAENNLVKTLQLFTMNDAGLKNYLSNNVEQFVNLVWYFNQNENEEVDKLLFALGCNAVYKDNRFTNCVFIQINSLDKLEAGFIYTTDSSVIPPMSSSEFVYVEQVLPGWYIYRIM
jgi:hypothetical protein